MGIGFAAAKSVLNIDGTATAVNTWSILIDSITPISNQTTATIVSAEVDPTTKTNATSLTTIEDGALSGSGLKNIDFGENSSIITIGTSAFESNQISSLTLGNGVTIIERGAFINQKNSDGNGTLTSILIKRTEEDFKANVTVGVNWYDTTLNPSFSYEPS